MGTRVATAPAPSPVANHHGPVGDGQQTPPAQVVSRQGLGRRPSASSYVSDAPQEEFIQDDDDDASFPGDSPVTKHLRGRDPGHHVTASGAKANPPRLDDGERSYNNAAESAVRTHSAKLARRLSKQRSTKADSSPARSAHSAASISSSSGPQGRRTATGPGTGATAKGAAGRPGSAPVAVPSTVARLRPIGALDGVGIGPRTASPEKDQPHDTEGTPSGAAHPKPQRQPGAARNGPTLPAAPRPHPTLSAPHAPPIAGTASVAPTMAVVDLGASLSFFPRRAAAFISDSITSPASFHEPEPTARACAALEAGTVAAGHTGWGVFCRTILDVVRRSSYVDGLPFLTHTNAESDAPPLLPVSVRNYAKVATLAESNIAAQDIAAMRATGVEDKLSDITASIRMAEVPDGVLAEVAALTKLCEEQQSTIAELQQELNKHVAAAAALPSFIGDSESVAAAERSKDDRLPTCLISGTLSLAPVLSPTKARRTVDSTGHLVVSPQRSKSPGHATGDASLSVLERNVSPNRPKHTAHTAAPKPSALSNDIATPMHGTELPVGTGGPNDARNDLCLPPQDSGLAAAAARTAAAAAAHRQRLTAIARSLEFFGAAAVHGDSTAANGRNEKETSPFTAEIVQFLQRTPWREWMASRAAQWLTGATRHVEAAKVFQSRQPFAAAPSPSSRPPSGGAPGKRVQPVLGRPSAPAQEPSYATATPPPHQGLQPSPMSHRSAPFAAKDGTAADARTLPGRPASADTSSVHGSIRTERTSDGRGPRIAHGDSGVFTDSNVGSARVPLSGSQLRPSSGRPGSSRPRLVELVEAHDGCADDDDDIPSPAISVTSAPSHDVDFGNASDAEEREKERKAADFAARKQRTSNADAFVLSRLETAGITSALERRTRRRASSAVAALRGDGDVPGQEFSSMLGSPVTDAMAVSDRSDTRGDDRGVDLLSGGGTPRVGSARASPQRPSCIAPIPVAGHRRRSTAAFPSTHLPQRSANPNTAASHMASARSIGMASLEDSSNRGAGPGPGGVPSARSTKSPAAGAVASAMASAAPPTTMLAGPSTVAAAAREAEHARNAARQQRFILSVVMRAWRCMIRRNTAARRFVRLGARRSRLAILKIHTLAWRGEVDMAKHYKLQTGQRLLDATVSSVRERLEEAQGESQTLQLQHDQLMADHQRMKNHVYALEQRLATFDSPMLFDFREPLYDIDTGVPIRSGTLHFRAHGPDARPEVYGYNDLCFDAAHVTPTTSDDLPSMRQRAAQRSHYAVRIESAADVSAPATLDEVTKTLVQAARRQHRRESAAAFGTVGYGQAAPPTISGLMSTVSTAGAFHSAASFAGQGSMAAGVRRSGSASPTAQRHSSGQQSGISPNGPFVPFVPGRLDLGSQVSAFLEATHGETAPLISDVEKDDDEVVLVPSFAAVGAKTLLEAAQMAISLGVALGLDAHCPSGHGGGAGVAIPAALEQSASLTSSMRRMSESDFGSGTFDSGLSSPTGPRRDGSFNGSRGLNFAAHRKYRRAQRISEMNLSASRQEPARSVSYSTMFGPRDVFASESTKPVDPSSRPSVRIIEGNTEAAKADTETPALGSPRVPGASVLKSDTKNQGQGGRPYHEPVSAKEAAARCGLTVSDSDVAVVPGPNAAVSTEGVRLNVYAIGTAGRPQVSSPPEREVKLSKKELELERQYRLFLSAFTRNPVFSLLMSAPPCQSVMAAATASYAEFAKAKGSAFDSIWATLAQLRDLRTREGEQERLVMAGGGAFVNFTSDAAAAATSVGSKAAPPGAAKKAAAKPPGKMTAEEAMVHAMRNATASDAKATTSFGGANSFGAFGSGGRDDPPVPKGTWPVASTRRPRAAIQLSSYTQLAQRPAVLLALAVSIAGPEAQAEVDADVAKVLATFHGPGLARAESVSMAFGAASTPGSPPGSAAQREAFARPDTLSATVSPGQPQALQSGDSDSKPPRTPRSARGQSNPNGASPTSAAIPDPRAFGPSSSGCMASSNGGVTDEDQRLAIDEYDPLVADYPVLLALHLVLKRIGCAHDTDVSAFCPFTVSLTAAATFEEKALVYKSAPEESARVRVAGGIAAAAGIVSEVGSPREPAAPMGSPHVAGPSAAGGGVGSLSPGYRAFSPPEDPLATTQSSVGGPFGTGFGDAHVPRELYLHLNPFFSDFIDGSCGDDVLQGDGDDGTWAARARARSDATARAQAAAAGARKQKPPATPLTAASTAPGAPTISGASPAGTAGPAAPVSGLLGVDLDSSDDDTPMNSRSVDAQHSFLPRGRGPHPPTKITSGPGAGREVPSRRDRRAQQDAAVQCELIVSRLAVYARLRDAAAADAANRMSAHRDTFRGPAAGADRDMAPAPVNGALRFEGSPTLADLALPRGGKLLARDVALGPVFTWVSRVLQHDAHVPGLGSIDDAARTVTAAATANGTAGHLALPKDGNVSLGRANAAAAGPAATTRLNLEALKDPVGAALVSVARARDDAPWAAALAAQGDLGPGLCLLEIIASRTCPAAAALLGGVGGGPGDAAAFNGAGALSGGASGGGGGPVGDNAGAARAALLSPDSMADSAVALVRAASMIGCHIPPFVREGLARGSAAARSLFLTALYLRLHAGHPADSDVIMPVGGGAGGAATMFPAVPGAGSGLFSPRVNGVDVLALSGTAGPHAAVNAMSPYASSLQLGGSVLAGSGAPALNLASPGQGTLTPPAAMQHLASNLSAPPSGGVGGIAIGGLSGRPFGGTAKTIVLPMPPLIIGEAFAVAPPRPMTEMLRLPSPRIHGALFPAKAPDTKPSVFSSAPKNTDGEDSGKKGKKVEKNPTAITAQAQLLYTAALPSLPDNFDERLTTVLGGRLGAPAVLFTAVTQGWRHGSLKGHFLRVTATSALRRIAKSGALVTRSHVAAYHPSFEAPSLSQSPQRGPSTALFGAQQLQASDDRSSIVGVPAALARPSMAGRLALDDEVNKSVPPGGSLLGVGGYTNTSARPSSANPSMKPSRGGSADARGPTRRSSGAAYGPTPQQLLQQRVNHVASEAAAMLEREAATQIDWGLRGEDAAALLTPLIHHWCAAWVTQNAGAVTRAEYAVNLQKTYLASLGFTAVVTPAVTPRGRRGAANKNRKGSPNQRRNGSPSSRNGSPGRRKSVTSPRGDRPRSTSPNRASVDGRASPPLSAAAVIAYMPSVYLQAEQQTELEELFRAHAVPQEAQVRAQVSRAFVHAIMEAEDVADEELRTIASNALTGSTLGTMSEILTELARPPPLPLDGGSDFDIDDLVSKTQSPIAGRLSPGPSRLLRTTSPPPQKSVRPGNAPPAPHRPSLVPGGARRQSTASLEGSQSRRGSSAKRRAWGGGAGRKSVSPPAHRKSALHQFGSMSSFTSATSDVEKPTALPQYPAFGAVPGEKPKKPTPAQQKANAAGPGGGGVFGPGGGLAPFIHQESAQGRYAPWWATVPSSVSELLSDDEGSSVRGPVLVELLARCGAAMSAFVAMHVQPLMEKYAAVQALHKHILALKKSGVVLGNASEAQPLTPRTLNDLTAQGWIDSLPELMIPDPLQCTAQLLRLFEDPIGATGFFPSVGGPITGPSNSDTKAQTDNAAAPKPGVSGMSPRSPGEKDFASPRPATAPGAAGAVGAGEQSPPGWSKYLKKSVAGMSGLGNVPPSLYGTLAESFESGAASKLQVQQTFALLSLIDQSAGFVNGLPSPWRPAVDRVRSLLTPSAVAVIRNRRVAIGALFARHSVGVKKSWKVLEQRVMTRAMFAHAIVEITMCVPSPEAADLFVSSANANGETSPSSATAEGAPPDGNASNTQLSSLAHVGANSPMFGPGTKHSPARGGRVGPSIPTIPSSSLHSSPLSAVKRLNPFRPQECLSGWVFDITAAVRSTVIGVAASGPYTSNALLEHDASHTAPQGMMTNSIHGVGVGGSAAGPPGVGAGPGAASAATSGQPGTLHHTVSAPTVPHAASTVKKKSGGADPAAQAASDAAAAVAGAMTVQQAKQQAALAGLPFAAETSVLNELLQQHQRALWVRKHHAAVYAAAAEVERKEKEKEREKEREAAAKGKRTPQKGRDSAKTPTSSIAAGNTSSATAGLESPMASAGGAALERRLSGVRRGRKGSVFDTGETKEEAFLRALSEVPPMPRRGRAPGQHATMGVVESHEFAALVASEPTLGFTGFCEALAAIGRGAVSLPWLDAGDALELFLDPWLAASAPEPAT